MFSLNGVAVAGDVGGCRFWLLNPLFRILAKAREVMATAALLMGSIKV